LAAAVRLLVLGAVRRRGRAHGYQVREDLQAWGAHEWSTATSGSVYHALKAMTGEGLLLLHDTSPSVAGGPPRMEYEVTRKGEDEYFVLLRNALSSREPRLDLLAAAVGLIDDLPRPQAIDLLRQRAKAMDAWRASITSHLPPDTKLESWGPVGEVLQLWLHTAESRAEWTHGLIRRLESGAFRMADDRTPDRKSEKPKKPVKPVKPRKRRS
jgi:DNA-binding PadR family transcriptional regulator